MDEFDIEVQLLSKEDMKYILMSLQYYKSKGGDVGNLLHKLSSKRIRKLYKFQKENFIK